MRIALLTEGGYPYACGESVVWCDRLVRGLDGHEFEVCALSRSRRQQVGGWQGLPSNVCTVRSAPLWGAPDPADSAASRGYGRRERRRFAGHFGELAAAICAESAETDRFSAGLYGLAQLARERGGLTAALRSEQAVRILEAACRAPGALRAVRAVQVADLLAVTERLERALRPLSLNWYGPCAEADDEGAGSADAGLAEVDVCHAVGGGPAALPGLLAKRAFGTPLLVTEYGVRLREHYLDSAGSTAHLLSPSAAGAPVRSLLASFQGQLAREAYRQAEVITPGNAHARRWQERCGADRERLRTVYPGMDATPFAAVADDGGEAEPSPTLVWVGCVEPTKDLIALLHAFAEVRKAEPQARLLIVDSRQRTGVDSYLAHCKALAAQLFPDEAADAVTMGDNPVSFEEVGSPGVPRLADAYAAGSVAVLSSVVEGLPVSLVEAMFCGRATVSTDVGAVCEVIGGTGLMVPPRNPRALAAACLALLRDPERRARLGAAARERAHELFTVEQNIAAFHGIYLELISRRPAGADDRPFARPAESHVPGHWAGRRTHALGGTSQPAGLGGIRGPSWARPVGVGALGREEEAR